MAEGSGNEVESQTRRLRSLDELPDINSKNYPWLAGRQRELRQQKHLAAVRQKQAADRPSKPVRIPVRGPK